MSTFDESSSRGIGRRGYKEHLSPFGDTDAHDPDPDVRMRFFGKYRGKVLPTIDPLGKGRLLVHLQDNVLGLFGSTWALPCLPLAGVLSGTFVRPPVTRSKSQKYSSSG